jgi:carbon starvation protein
MLIRMKKARYAWITACPGIFLAFITMWAGYIQITQIYLPQGRMLLTVLGSVILCLMVVVLVGATKRCLELLRIRTTMADAHGDAVLALVEE